MFSATSRSTAKGLSVIAFVLRISWRSSSGGRKPPPSTPRPPALDTAAASSAMETLPMPARMMGCSIPRSSVISVRIIARLLAPLELGLALLQEGGSGLLQVIGAHRRRLQEGGNVESHVELVAEELVHGVLGPAERHGRAFREPLRPLHRHVHDLVGRNSAGGEADLRCLSARDPVPRQQVLLCPGPAEEERPDNAPSVAGDEAHPHVRGGDASALRSDDDVAEQSERRAEAGGIAVDGG